MIFDPPAEHQSFAIRIHRNFLEGKRREIRWDYYGLDKENYGDTNAGVWKMFEHKIARQNFCTYIRESLESVL